MAMTQGYTAVPNDVITAARWNNEFGNIYNNGTRVAFPITEAVSFGGYAITIDGAGVTTLSTSASVGFTLTPGAKAGTPGTTGSQVNVVASTFTDTSTAGSGVAAAFAAVTLQRPTLVATSVTVTTTDAATLYIANSPLASTNETITNPWALWVDAGNVRLDGDLSLSGMPRGTLASSWMIGGLSYANAAGDPTNDITVNAGEAASGDTAVTSRRLLILTSAITKQLDAAWAVGTNQGGLDTGSIGNSDYYVWLISRADTGVVDVLFSLSSTAPTMPTDYTFKRLIGWFKRVAAAIVPFHTYEISGGGLELLWDSPTLDISLANTLTTSRRTDAVKVPLNLSTFAHLNVIMADAAVAFAVAYVCCPDQTDLAPSITVAPLSNLFTQIGRSHISQLFVRTSATGTIAARADTATIDSYLVVTIGFAWSRRN